MEHLTAVAAVVMVGIVVAVAVWQVLAIGRDRVGRDEPAGTRAGERAHTRRQ